MEAISLSAVRSGAWLSYVVFLLSLGSARAAENCDYGVKQLWSSSLRNSPITATPLLFDVDGDGYKDIVAPSFSGEVWAIHGESGHIVDNWPFYLDDRGFHSSPLVYDINSDGVLDFLLSTTEAEILFIQPDSSLLHGETVKLPPLRVQREWFTLDPAYLSRIAEELSRQINNPEHFTVNKHHAQDSSFQKTPANFSSPYSEYESRYGRHSDPLFSRHQPTKRTAGIDPIDPSYVYIDPHILATPTLTDTNGDGLQDELVVPVSYYFDPYYYGEPRHLAELGGLRMDEVQNFIAGGIVVVDLNSGRLLHHKLLGITQAGSGQPGYMLATPTVVKLFPGKGDTMIIVGSVTGELHLLNANTLESVAGFPVILDSISGQVAVADLVNDDGALELVVGDASGNIYCIDRTGKRAWEVETGMAILSSPRFIDIEGDGKLEVVITTRYGSVHILHGDTGTALDNFPVHLSTPVQSSVLLMHLNSTTSNNAPSVIVPSINTLYIVDAVTGCIDTVTSEHMFLEVQADDIDPFSPGIELLASSLDGLLVCFASSRMTGLTGYEMAVESWPGEAIGQNGFTHKLNSFAVVFPYSNLTTREISGRSFTLDFELYDNPPHQSKLYTILVTVGKRDILYSDRLPVYQRKNAHSISVRTPAEPLHGFLTVQVCNEYLQCDSFSFNARFNLHFEDNLKWFLCLPFLSLCGMFLWLLRDFGFEALPTTYHTRKNL